jgi:PAS domain S-box-containing protein
MGEDSMGAPLPGKEEAIERLEAYQQRLDQAAAQADGAYDRLFDQAPPGLALHEIDAQGTMRRVNAQELELIGRRADELLGKSVWTFAVMEDASRRAVERKLAGGGLKPFVRTLTRGDGTGATAAFVERYLRDGTGAIVGIRTALMQISG